MAKKSVKKTGKKQTPNLPAGPAAPPEGVVDTQEKVARHFGVSTRTVQYWVRDGMPKGEDGFFDIEAIKQWREERDLFRGRGGDSERSTLEKRKIKAQAELAELEYQRRTGDLIPREEIEEGRIQRILAVKKKLLMLPRALAPQVVGVEVRHAQSIIEKRIKEIINEFAQGRADVEG